MGTRPPDSASMFQPTPPHIAELERLGDEIAELSVHLEAATARLLALIREFYPWRLEHRLPLVRGVAGVAREP